MGVDPESSSPKRNILACPTERAREQERAGERERERETEGGSPPKEAILSSQPRQPSIGAALKNAKFTETRPLRWDAHITALFSPRPTMPAPGPLLGLVPCRCERVWVGSSTMAIGPSTSSVKAENRQCSSGGYGFQDHIILLAQSQISQIATAGSSHQNPRQHG